MPDYSTPLTRLAESKLKPMDLGNESSFSGNTIDRGPCNLGEGIVYYGQWTLDGRRNGRGV